MKTLEETLRNSEILDEMRNRPQDFKFSTAPNLRVAVEIWSPHLDFILDENNQIKSMRGPMAEVLYTLAESLNFTYELVRPADGSWGAIKEDGTWSGMVGMVYRDEADLALGPFVVKKDRAEVIQYAPTLLGDYYRALVIQNSPVPDPWGFLLPFNLATWLGIFLCLLVVSFGILFIHGIFVRSKWSSYIGDAIQVVFGFARMLLQQDLKVTTVVWSVRFLIGSWILFVLVITKSYSSALTSLLAVRNLPKPFKTFQDLIDYPTYDLYIEKGSAFEGFIKSSNDGGTMENLKKLYDVGRLDEFKNDDLPLLFHKIKEGAHYAIVYEELSSLALISRDFSQTGKCNFYMLEEFLLPSSFSIIGQKGSPIMNVISTRIHSIHAAGLYSNWVKNMIPNVTACTFIPNSVSVSEPYSIIGLWGIFAFLGYGFVLSMVVFIAEFMTSKMLYTSGYSRFDFTQMKIHKT